MLLIGLGVTVLGLGLKYGLEVMLLPSPISSLHLLYSVAVFFSFNALAHKLLVITLLAPLVFVFLSPVAVWWS